MKKRITWTRNKIFETAKDYSSKTEFRKAFPRAYDLAKELGIFESVCSHMVSHKSRKWEDDQLMELAKSYSSYVELKKSNPSAFHAIKNRGLLPYIRSMNPDFSNIRIGSQILDKSGNLIRIKE